MKVGDIVVVKTIPAIGTLLKPERARVTVTDSFSEFSAEFIDTLETVVKDHYGAIKTHDCINWAYCMEDLAQEIDPTNLRAYESRESTVQSKYKY